MGSIYELVTPVMIQNVESKNVNYKETKHAKIFSN